jgi:hypothetical protein
MAERAKRRSLSQKLGRTGELIFAKWATEHGFTTNKSEDDFGIDFFCQQLKPLSRRIEEVTGVVFAVQARATSRPARPCVVLERDDVETALRVNAPFCLVAVLLNTEEISFRFLDTALLEEWTSFLKSDKKTYRHYIERMQSGTTAFVRGLEQVSSPGFRHMIEESKAKARLEAALPQAVLEVRGGPRGFTLVTVPVLSAIFHLADTNSHEDAMRLFFTPEPFETSFESALKRFPVHEPLKAVAGLSTGPMVVMGEAETSVRLFVERHGQREEAAFLERRIGDVRAYIARSGLVIEISDAREDKATGHFHHHCSSFVVQQGASNLLASGDLPFLKLLHPGAQLNEVGRDGLSIEMFNAQHLGAAVEAVEKVFAALKIPLDEAYLADFNDPEFGRKVGFLDAVLDRETSTPIIPTFIIGVPESETLDEHQWRPGTYRVPVVLNLKGRAVVVWLEGEADGYLYEGVIHGFRFKSASFVRADANFPEHPSVKGIEAWIYEDWPALPLSDPPASSFNATKHGSLPFGGHFSMVRQSYGPSASTSADE